MKTLNNDLAAIQLTQVIEQLEDLLFCDLVTTYNDYASQNGYEMIYDNNEITINEMYTNAYDAVRVTNHKRYDNKDDYFTYGGNGKMISFSYQLTQDDNSPIDISELAEWLINEDKLADYDITVTTTDDMLASIEDSITDDENMLNSLIVYSNIELECYKSVIDKGYDCYNDYSIAEVMNYLEELEYSELSDIINYLGINYQ